MPEYINETTIAFVALIVTVITSFLTFLQAQKFNKQNLRSNFYLNIYSEYLNVTIPVAFKKLRFNGNNRLDDFNDLVDCLDEMKMKSMYFKFTNEKMFESLVNCQSKRNTFKVNAMVLRLL